MLMMTTMGNSGGQLGAQVVSADELAQLAQDIRKLSGSEQQRAIEFVMQRLSDENIAKFAVVLFGAGIDPSMIELAKANVLAQRANVVRPWMLVAATAGLGVLGVVIAGRSWKRRAVGGVIGGAVGFGIAFATQRALAHPSQEIPNQPPQSTR